MQTAQCHIIFQAKEKQHFNVTEHPFKAALNDNLKRAADGDVPRELSAPSMADVFRDKSLKTHNTIQ